MLDKDKFINLMTGLCEVFNKVPSEFIFDLYYRMFERYDFEEIEKAVTACLKSYKYNCLPKPAEIVEFLEGSKDDKALKAWMEVIEAIRIGGYYESVEFADPIISHSVNELGGWMWLCSQQKDQMPFIEKRFKDLYRLLLKRGTKEGVKLVGYVESSNNNRGYFGDIPVPIKIGFKEDKKITHA